MLSSELNSHLSTTPEISIPELSVVVVVVSDTIQRTLDLSILRGCLESLNAQDQPPILEVIVPYLVGTADFDALAIDFPGVNFLQIHRLAVYIPDGIGREHHDELRAYGIRATSGKIIALIEDYARLGPGWSREIIQAHSKPYTGIGGAIENGVDRPLNWALYFCDFGRYQNPFPAGESTYANEANVSYKRADLLSIETIWRDLFNGTQVNWELINRGYKIALDPKIILYQNLINLSLSDALIEMQMWGRSYAAGRIKVVGKPQRILYAVTSPLIPFLLFARVTARALSKPNNLSRYFKAFILIFLLLVLWAIGEATGYFSGHA